LEEFCAKLKDGHTRILPPDELADTLYSRPLIITNLIEDKVIVTDLLDEKLSSDGIKKGIEIVEIEGVPVKKYAEEKLIPYSSDSTRQAQNLTVYSWRLLAGAAGQPVNLTFRDENGKTFPKSLPRIAWSEWRKNLPSQKPFEMKLLEGNVMYIKINTFNNNTPAEEFAKNYDTIAKADAVIFDIRDNGGGNSNVGWEILSYLTEGDFKTSRWRTREYHPTFRAWGREEFGYGEEAEAFKKEVKQTFTKPVVVLTSPRTASAAEDFSVAFKAAKRGLIIGEPTNGSTGQPLIISLPGGGRAGICTKYDSFPDGAAFVGVGVLPDINIGKTIEDFRAGRDRVLEKALSELKK
jgi:C-terminal processing protease CtpA/Prc